MDSPERGAEDSPERGDTNSPERGAEDSPERGAAKSPAQSEQTLPARRLILIHGHGHKPLAGELENLWRSALRRGLERDHGKVKRLLDDVAIDFVYYGDLTREQKPRGGPVDEHLDLADRYTALAELSQRGSKKQFRSHHYHRMRGRSGVGKLLMHVSAPVARGLGLEQQLMARVFPDLARYRSDAGFAEQARSRLLEVLAPALARGEDVMLVAHCLGSVIAYDCLWLLSRGEARLDHKVRTLMTLGSPLASDAVRAGLMGAREAVDLRYPGNITYWFNLAAEDDYVCHDATVANDFAPMLDRHGISRLQDYGIFNLARRYGRPNPHSSLGYLIHPRTAALLSDWLRYRPATGDPGAGRPDA